MAEEIVINEERSETIKVDEKLEQIFGGLFVLENNNELVVSNRPDWVKDPSGEKHYVHDMHIARIEIYCPMCNNKDKHGIITTEDGLVILCCKGCKQFIWTRIK